MSFLCCCGSNNVKVIRPLEISSDVQLETYGQIQTTATNSKQTPNNGAKRKQKVEKTSKTQELLSKTDVNGNKVKVQKQTIAIQAGSPLSKTRTQITKTTLSYSNEEDNPNFKNPFHKLAKKTDLKQQDSPKETPKVLRPLKQNGFNKRLTSNKKGGDVVLEPIDTSIPKKLVPVDKDFLKRLEKHTSQASDYSSAPVIAAQNKGKSSHKTVRPNSVLKRSQPNSVKSSPRKCNDSATTTTGSSKEPKTTAMALIMGDVEQPVASLSKNTEIKEKREGSDNKLYDCEELDLMNEIEKEFANLL